MDVSVGSSGSVVLTFNTTSIVSGGPVAITSFPSRSKSHRPSN
jgi:hypothetical protein